MPQVPLTVNGRTYRLGCGEGEQDRLKELGQHVAKKVDSLVAEFGQAGESRLLLMAAILIADELFDARSGLDNAVSDRVDALKQVAASAQAGAGKPAEKPTTDKADKKPSRIEVPGRAGSGS